MVCVIDKIKVTVIVMEFLRLSFFSKKSGMHMQHIFTVLLESCPQHYSYFCGSKC